jgi:hypothetical protein
MFAIGNYCDVKIEIMFEYKMNFDRPLYFNNLFL